MFELGYETNAVATAPEIHISKSYFAACPGCATPSTLWIMVIVTALDRLLGRREAASVRRVLGGGLLSPFHLLGMEQNLGSHLRELVRVFAVTSLKGHDCKRQ
jgi:hypothetical protein